MANTAKTAIVTGASQGIGAGLVEAFLQRGYSVVANSRHITKTNPFAYLVKASDNAEGVDSSVFEGIKNAIRADRASFTVDFLKNSCERRIGAVRGVSDEHAFAHDPACDHRNAAEHRRRTSWDSPDRPHHGRRL